MRAAFLPGNRKVELRTLRTPHPGHGEVLLRVKASTICGSDIRCIYHEHLGKGPEGYQGVIAGHEPSGKIVEVGKALAIGIDLEHRASPEGTARRRGAKERIAAQR